MKDKKKKEMIYARVLRINSDLRDLGMSWDEVEDFWRECMDKGRQKHCTTCDWMGDGECIAPKTCGS